MADPPDLSDLWLEGVDDGLGPSAANRRRAARRQRGRRLVGFPFAFLADVCRLTEGRAILVVAALIYRRMCVCNSRTVTLPSAELAEVGVDRSLKRKALARLEAAGIIRIEKAGPGRAIRVTLLWQNRTG